MMPTLEMPPTDVSQTTPCAIHLIKEFSETDWPTETPRFAWHREPEPKPKVVTHAYRLVMASKREREGSMWETRAQLIPAPGDVPVRVVADDPWATDDAGVGYRSYQLLCPAHTETSFYPELQPGSFDRSLYGAVAATAKFDEGVFLRGFTQEAWYPLIARMSRILLEWITALQDEVARLYVPVHKTNQVEAPTNPAAAERETHVSAVRWLEEHVGLSQEAIGTLVGVSRQTVHNWLYKGAAIRDENRQRLLAVREILERVQRRDQGSEALKTWLDTPRGSEAKTPRQLLIANEIGKARALSLSTAVPRSRSAPAWLRDSPPDPWTRRQLHRRERIVREGPESDASPSGDSGEANRG